MKIYKIYKIIDNTTNKPIYIGCTSQTLNKRLWQHNHDVQSQVYKHFISKGNNNLRIELITKKQCTSSQAIKLEEIFTYIYGYGFKICNYNAGSIMFEDNNTEPLYDSIHFILNEFLENTLPITESAFTEIISCIAKILNYPLHQITKETLLELDDICCEKICNEDY